MSQDATHSPVGPSDTALLAAIVDPLSADEFLNEFWPDEPFVTHGVLERLPPPFDDPMLKGFEALAPRYRGRVLFGRGARSPRTALARSVSAAELYGMGLSLYLPDLEPLLPSSGLFLRSLERVLGLAPGEARITAWASPKGDGVAAHLDAEEVFSIQLVGTKRFYVAEPAALPSPVGYQYAPGAPPLDDHFPQAPNGLPDPGEARFTEMVMAPGSVLFLPRGHWHWTRTDSDSLSVSIALSPRAPVDRLITRLRALLLQDPRWRRPAYGERERARLEAVLAELPGLLTRLTPADLGLGDAATIRTPRYQRAPGMQPALAYDDDGGKAEAWIAVRRASFTLDDLLAGCPDVEPAAAAAALERWTSCGAVRRLAFEPLEQFKRRAGGSGSGGA